MINSRCWATVILSWIVLTSSVCAADLGVGDSVPSFSGKDQFGRRFEYNPGLLFLFLGFDRNAGQEATFQLTELGAGWLDNHAAAFVLDIHNMPAIARAFAIPKMRKCPERIILCDDKKTLAPFPRKPEEITVLTLSAEGKIKDIRHWNPVKERIRPRNYPVRLACELIAG